MTWKPTQGLKVAESVTQTILNDLVACGVPPITNPEARFRIKQIIANALDGFQPVSVAEFLEEREEPPHQNGGWREGEKIRLSTGQVGTFGEVLRDEQLTVAEVFVEAGKPPSAKKRGRGRPKGAKAKKAKAAPKADAVEATAS